MRWLTYNVLWEIGAGVTGGYLIGRAFGRSIRYTMPRRQG